MKLNGSERILIIKPSAFGDVVHALAVVDQLKRTHPNLSISWLVNRDYASLIEDNPLIDTIYIFDRNQWGIRHNPLATAQDVARLINKIRAAHFDIVIDLQCLLRSGFITRCSGAPIRIGLSDAREGSKVCYNRVVTVSDKHRHAVDRYLKVVDLLGVSRSNPVRFPLQWSNADEQYINTILSNCGLDADKIIVAINPNARWESKCWAKTNFAQLADRIIERYDAQVLFTGTAADVSSVNEICNMMRHKAIVMAGKTTVKQLAVLLHKADVMVTNDSGPMHLAVAVELPVVALFGPTNPLKTGPYGSEHTVLRASDFSCQPCMRRVCRQSVHCMDAISVDNVISSVDVILDKKKHNAACDR